MGFCSYKYPKVIKQFAIRKFLRIRGTVLGFVPLYTLSKTEIFACGQYLEILPSI